MNSKIILKNQIKDLALQVRQSKLNYKEKERAFSRGEETVTTSWGKYPSQAYHDAFNKKHSMTDTYRYMHIAYSLLKGNNYLQIESKVASGNEPHVEQVNRNLEQMCVDLSLETYPHYYPIYEGEKFDMIIEEEKPVNPNLVTKHLEKKRDDLLKEIAAETSVQE